MLRYRRKNTVNDLPSTAKNLRSKNEKPSTAKSLPSRYVTAVKIPSKNDLPSIAKMLPSKMGKPSTAKKLTSCCVTVPSKSVKNIVTEHRPGIYLFLKCEVYSSSRSNFPRKCSKHSFLLLFSTNMHFDLVMFFFWDLEDTTILARTKRYGVGLGGRSMLLCCYCCTPCKICAMCGVLWSVVVQQYHDYRLTLVRA